MSAMERSPLLIGAVVLTIIVVSTVAALFADRRVFLETYAVDVELSSAGGLAVGDPVIVAGLRAGDVRALELEDGRVLAGVRIEGHRLPADTGALVRSQTVLGQEVLELQPGTAEDALADGDRIPLERTTVALDIVAVADRAEALLSEVDTGGLDRVLAGLTDVTVDQREQVGDLADGVTRLSRVVTAKDAEIRELLRSLRSVAGAVNDRDAELLATLDGFDVTLATLAARRDDLRALIRDTSGTAAAAADLVEDQRDDIDVILTELHATSAMLNRRQLDLAETLAYSGDAISGFASVGFNGPVGVPWANILVTSYGPAGIDYIGGCGGLLDQALDRVLGPDPRSCAEQDNQLPLPGERDEAAPPDLGEALPLPELQVPSSAGSPDPAGGVGGVGGLDQLRPGPVPGVGAIAARALRGGR